MNAVSKFFECGATVAQYNAGLLGHPMRPSAVAQQRLYFRPDPHGQGAFRLTWGTTSVVFGGGAGRESWGTASISPPPPRPARRGSKRVSPGRSCVRRPSPFPPEPNSTASGYQACRTAQRGLQFGKSAGNRPWQPASEETRNRIVRCALKSRTERSYRSGERIMLLRIMYIMLYSRYSSGTQPVAAHNCCHPANNRETLFRTAS